MQVTRRVSSVVPFCAYFRKPPLSVIVHLAVSLVSPVFRNYVAFLCIPSTFLRIIGNGFRGLAFLVKESYLFLIQGREFGRIGSSLRPFGKGFDHRTGILGKNALSIGNTIYLNLQFIKGTLVGLDPLSLLMLRLQFVPCGFQSLILLHQVCIRTFERPLVSVLYRIGSLRLRTRHEFHTRSRILIDTRELLDNSSEGNHGKPDTRTNHQPLDCQLRRSSGIGSTRQCCTEDAHDDGQLGSDGRASRLHSRG